MCQCPKMKPPFGGKNNVESVIVKVQRLHGSANVTELKSWKLKYSIGSRSMKDFFQDLKSWKNVPPWRVNHARTMYHPVHLLALSLPLGLIVTDPVEWCLSKKIWTVKLPKKKPTNKRIMLLCTYQRRSLDQHSLYPFTPNLTISIRWMFG